VLPKNVASAVFHQFHSQTEDEKEEDK
jgi:hypothetical protein